MSTYLDRIHEHVAALEPLRTFPTVDELQRRADAVVAEHPDRVAAVRIGTSRLGEPIVDHVVGHGPAILVVGGVHPNEPIGFHSALQLLEDVARGEGPAAELEATWHVIVCADPDGTRLNESWFADPADRVTYAQGFYRPAPDEQVEWSFPLDHRGVYFDDSIPETRAIMRLVDRIEPALVVGLHNGELGGVYYYLGGDQPGLVDALHEIPARLGLPLDAGEPESPDLEPIAPAIFRAITAREQVDWLLEHDLEPAHFVDGGGLADYVERHGSATFVAELPYWSHPDSDDVSPSGERYADVLRHKADELDELGRVLGETLDAAIPHLRIDSQLRRATEAFVALMRVMGTSERQRSDAQDPERIATVAERFSNADVVRCFRLRFGSMLARTLGAEVAAGTASAEVHRALRALQAELDAWYDEARSVEGLVTWPVERLVGVQYGSLLAVAASTLGALQPAPSALEPA